MMGKFIVGIDPKQKRTVVVAIDTQSGWDECRDMGLIVVPVSSAEKARATWGEIIDDVYNLAAAA